MMEKNMQYNLDQKNDILPLKLLKNGEQVVEKSNEIHHLCPYNGILDGALILTNFSLLFQSHQDGANLVIPLGVIYRVDKFGNLSTPGDNVYGIEIQCKDMRNIKFSFPPQEHSRRQMYRQLIKYAFPINNNLPLWAFLNPLGQSNDVNGWSIYNPIREYARMGVPDEYWRLSDVNKIYGLCDTYPKILCVPKEASDDLLKSVASFRSKGRIPVLSWKNHHYNNNNNKFTNNVKGEDVLRIKAASRLSQQTAPYLSSEPQTDLPNISDACILRGSQPLSGLSNVSSINDKAYIKMIIDTNSHFSRTLTIFDARPRINAVANKAKGGGYESEQHYKDIEFVFLDIPNIHVMRDSYKKLVKECYPYVDEFHWFSKLESTQWMDHIRSILFGALKIVDKVDNQQSSVFIHCSDGWDRTAQLTSLAMLMLDPYYRTIEGFEVLIEKEWLSFGHKFSQRHAHGFNNHYGGGGIRTLKTNIPDISQTTLAPTSLAKQSNGTSESLPGPNKNDKTLEASKPLFKYPFKFGQSKDDKNPKGSKITNKQTRQNSLSNVSLSSTNSSVINNDNTIKLHASSNYKIPKNKSNEVSPIFLQFIDCVHQLTRQFPSAFEFEQRFLIKIMDEVYACNYGTFLGNCDKERQEMGTHSKTVSLWTDLNCNLDEYTNPFFYPPPPNSHPSSLVLYPVITLRHLEFWNELYLRWNPHTKFHEPFQRKNFHNLQNLKRKLENEVYELTKRIDSLSHNGFVSDHDNPSCSTNIARSDQNSPCTSSTRPNSLVSPLSSINNFAMAPNNSNINGTKRLPPMHYNYHQYTTGSTPEHSANSTDEQNNVWMQSNF